MPDTHKPTSQVVATSREAAARFALQMAQQARKFGARIAELRDERNWIQRDLVAEMERLGDQSLNTNQLSRYENGGAMPGEQRQEWFAQALGTTVDDLYAGPVAERKPKETPDLLPTSDAEPPWVDEFRQQVLWLRSAVEQIGEYLDIRVAEQDEADELPPRSEDGREDDEDEGATGTEG